MARTTVKEIKANAKAQTTKAKATTKVTSSKANTKAKATTKTGTKKTTNVTKETKEMEKNLAGIELTAEEIELIKQLRNDKANEKKETAKATSTQKKASKTADKAKEGQAEEKPFNKDRYYSIANALDVLGQNGVYKFARPTVYEVMDKEKITQSILDKAKEQLIEKATEMKLDWYLKKVGAIEDVEVDEEEVI